MHYVNIYYKFMKISPRLRCIYLFVISRGFPSKRRLSPVRIYDQTQSVSQSNFYRVYISLWRRKEDESGGGGECQHFHSSRRDSREIYVFSLNEDEWKSRLASELIEEILDRLINKGVKQRVNVVIALSVVYLFLNSRIGGGPVSRTIT